MSKLLEAQFHFSRLLPRLLDQAHNLGLEVSMGECWRTPQQAEWNAAHGLGSAHSLHCDRLAVDLNLFRNGELLAGTDPDIEALGEYWESQGGSWGGRFRDWCHFSLAYGGRK